MINKFFVASAAIGLALNLYGDVLILQQNRTAVQTGDWVSKSYQALGKINAAKMALMESEHIQLAPDFHDNLTALKPLMIDKPLQSARLDSLEKMSVSDVLLTKNNPAIAALNEMSAAETALLAERLKVDEASNDAAVNKAILASAFDILLIFIFVGFFFYERNASLKLQNTLSKALIHVETGHQQLQAALANKDERFKTVIHDLKNPLGSIKGFAELLSDEASNKESVMEMAHIIQRVSNNTLSLVSKMLQEDDSLLSPKESLNVFVCLKETCAYLEPIAREKNQRIVIKKDSCDFSFLASRQQLQDVFFNIVGNALKFSPKGSTVTVETLLQDKFHEVRISDQGPGFTEEDFPKLFTPQAKLTAKPTGGEVSTGFGLYSVKRTVEKFNGTVEITNNTNGGASVTIKFPFET